MTATVRQARRNSKGSVAEWLELLESDGPFLAAPVAREAWPNGLPALDREAVGQLRDASALLDASPGTRDRFVQSVLVDFLEWGDPLRSGPDLPPGLVTQVPEHRTEVRPDFALARPEDGRALLLGMVTAPGTRSSARTLGSTWPASPADRLAYAMRMQGVPLGLITDGTEWTLVCWVPSGAVATVAWTRHVWLDDVQTLQAFHALLCRQRFFGVDDAATLPALLKQSLERQEEVTERLKAQSQAVVDMLVATLGRLDVESRARNGTGVLPDDVAPSEVYAGCVTILMRTIFLLYAEERHLLPADDPIYSSSYAATTLAAELEERSRDGEELLERSSTAWQRLLATSRAIHRGARHQDLQLPAYGGSLFDPDRYPWLEGRSSPEGGLAGGSPPPIDDRTMLHSLNALQTLRFGKERRRLSFRQLDVEQIGYVFEGLMGQDAIRSDGWVLGVAGDSRGESDGPELALDEMELKLEGGPEAFASWLAPLTKTSGGSGRSEKAIVRDLLREADEHIRRDVLAACSGDEATAAAILPFGSLLRRDPRELPVVYPPESLYLTDSDVRANTGSVYTPRALAEQVVSGALAPLVHSPGPLDTEDRSQWQVLTSDRILGLRVIDIAVGSGAFLVAAARYLADKLIESRAVHEGLKPQHERQAEEVERQAIREIVDQCIYGVDVNPMAVEMCKLSLWLVTLDPARPFTFLDDRIRVGDSLLGITAVDQLVALHMDPAAGRNAARLPNFDADVQAVLTEAAALRRHIAEIPLVDTHAADDKARLLQKAEGVTESLRRVADALSAASLAGGRDYGIAGQLAAALFADTGEVESLEDDVRFRLTDRGGQVRRPAHFPLLFPEAFDSEKVGFNAVIGNPPYLGGQKLTGVLGTDYRDHLVRQCGRGVRGSADLVAYFLLTAAALGRRESGSIGVITTNTIAQGDTREVGLDQLCGDGWDIVGAVKSDKWPTHAVNLEYSIVWASRASRGEGVRSIADGVPVARLTSSLEAAGSVEGQPYRLGTNAGISFQGSIVLGQGFTMSEAEARALIDHDPRNADVLFPYVNGEDLNSRPDCSASRWVINFFDWPEERAREYPDCWAIIEGKVRPERQRRQPDGSFKLRRPLPERYWIYAEKRPGLHSTIAGLDRVLAITLVSKVVLPLFVPTGQVFSNALGVFASRDPAMLALLSSAPHYWWAISRASTMRTDLRYTPSDVFETLPLPGFTSAMREAGDWLDRVRRDLMLQRQMGLTKTYNRVHDPRATEPAVRELRNIHVAIDEAVCRAYGWSDPTLGHGHHETRQGVRWTIAPAVQAEILDRLLALNHERHAEEQASGTMRAPRRRGARTAGSGQAELLMGDRA